MFCCKPFADVSAFHPVLNFLQFCSPGCPPAARKKHSTPPAPSTSQSPDTNPNPDPDELTQSPTKSAHPGAKKALAEIWNAEDRQHALAAEKAFSAAYAAKFPQGHREDHR